MVNNLGILPELSDASIPALETYGTTDIVLNSKDGRHLEFGIGVPGRKIFDMWNLQLPKAPVVFRPPMLRIYRVKNYGTHWLRALIQEKSSLLNSAPILQIHRPTVMLAHGKPRLAGGIPRFRNGETVATCVDTWTAEKGIPIDVVLRCDEVFGLPWGDTGIDSATAWSDVCAQHPATIYPMNTSIMVGSIIDPKDDFWCLNVIVNEQTNFGGPI